MTDELPDFTDRAEAEAWLLTQPLEVSSTIALRSALRSVPFLIRVPELPEGDDKAARFALLLLRMLTPQWVASGWSDEVEAGVNSALVRAAARRIGNHALDAAVAAVSMDALSAFEATESGAASAFHHASFSATNTEPSAASLVAQYGWSPAGGSDFTFASAADAKARAAGQKTRVVFGSPLWPTMGFAETGAIRVWAVNAWASLRVHLRQRGDEHWHVWTDWYDARLRGDPIDWELERARLQPPKVWDAGAKVLNEAILRRMEEIQAQRAEADPVLAQISRWINELRSAQSGLQHAPAAAFQTPEEANARAGLIEAARNVLAALDANAPRSRGIGDNNPPPEERLGPEDFDELKQQMAALAARLEPSPVAPSEVAKPVAEVASIWERTSGLFTEEFAKSYGKTLGTSAAVATTLGLSAAAAYAGDIQFAEAFTTFVERLVAWVATLRPV
ncbi:MAG: hypothetical protein AAF763_11835 [Pseudomonadota bacterium]